MIERWVGDLQVLQREQDGFVSITNWCLAIGKLQEQWLASRSVRAAQALVAKRVGCQPWQLVDRRLSTQGAVAWLHPQLMVQLALGMSPEWALCAGRWLWEWEQAGNDSLSVPERHARIEPCPLAYEQFSLFNELTLHFVAPLRRFGFPWPARLMPGADDDEAFERWLKLRGAAGQGFARYSHRGEDGQGFTASLYPVALYPLLREYFHCEWVGRRAQRYFAGQPQVPLHLLRLPEAHG
ncbi:hypothetical protein [Pseudomonas sp. KNUC1026]|uniref:hypothetical protein n=1 Tax=Pseudomonas sp. KNUC1026 TaxID=2893890 RepID=UPI001F3D835D|nr:hypothetical protein [Pseudomonas sp. KNUC1026]UFH48367.1 hypothetical protein LN139_14560 [Pseudomonas sp. KNUC1026]